MGKIATRADCNTIVPNSFNNNLTMCPTKQEVLDTGNLIVTGNYQSNQLVEVSSILPPMYNVNARLKVVVDGSVVGKGHRINFNSALVRLFGHTSILNVPQVTINNAVVYDINIGSFYDSTSNFNNSLSNIGLYPVMFNGQRLFQNYNGNITVTVYRQSNPYSNWYLRKDFQFSEFATYVESDHIPLLREITEDIDDLVFEISLLFSNPPALIWNFNTLIDVTHPDAVFGEFADLDFDFNVWPLNEPQYETYEISLSSGALTTSFEFETDSITSIEVGINASNSFFKGKSFRDWGGNIEISLYDGGTLLDQEYWTLDHAWASLSDPNGFRNHISYRVEVNIYLRN